MVRRRASQSLADLPLPQKIISVLLRVAFVVLLGLGLSRLARTATTEKVCTVYLVDVSDSISDEALADARALVDRAWAEKPEDAIVKLITFARRPRLGEPSEKEPEKAPPIERHADAKGERGELGAGTNLQAAVQLAYGLYPGGYLKRAVLVSDGVQTDGDFLAEANRAKDFGIRLFTVPYRRPAPPEVAVRELRLPDHVKVGETFEVHADIYASRATTAKAKLYQSEALNGLEGIKDLTLKAGVNDVVFKSVVRIKGATTYKLDLEQIAQDRFPENNRYATTIDVPGRPVVLYIEGTPQHGQPLSSALTAQQIDVDMRPPAGFPGSLKRTATLRLRGHVRHAEGGRLAPGAGLDRAVRARPRRRVPLRGRRVRLRPRRLVPHADGADAPRAHGQRAQERDAERGDERGHRSLGLDDGPAAGDGQGRGAGHGLRALIRRSGGGHRLRLRADALREDAAGAQPGAHQRGDRAHRARRRDGDLPALDAAYQDMTVTQARKKHVILLTDGRAPAGGIRDLASAMIAESITVTTVGLGGDVDEQLLKMVADVGGGRFHAVQDANNLPASSPRRPR